MLCDLEGGQPRTDNLAIKGAWRVPHTATAGDAKRNGRSVEVEWQDAAAVASHVYSFVSLGRYWVKGCIEFECLANGSEVI